MVGFRNKGFKLLPLLLAGCILMTSQGVMARVRKILWVTLR